MELGIDLGKYWYNKSQKGVRLYGRHMSSEGRSLDNDVVVDDGGDDDGDGDGQYNGEMYVIYLE